jgi:hypothetical protein
LLPRVNSLKTRGRSDTEEPRSYNSNPHSNSKRKSNTKSLFKQHIPIGTSLQGGGGNRKNRGGLGASLHGVVSGAKSLFKQHTPISTSLHGEEEKRNNRVLHRGGLVSSLHGVVSGAKSSLSNNSLHGLRRSSIGGAQTNALQAEPQNLRRMLRAFTEENDELLQDLNAVLDENDFLNKELIKVCDENENLVEDKQDLKEQLEEAQFEQEEAQLKYKDHMATCHNSNNTGNGKRGAAPRSIQPRQRRGSVMDNMADIRKAVEFLSQNHQNQVDPDGPNNSNRSINVDQAFNRSYNSNLTPMEPSSTGGASALAQDDDDMPKLALSSMQAEMARKTRAWEEESRCMQAQMQKYQNEMEQLRDAAQGVDSQQKAQKVAFRRLGSIVEDCDLCRTTHDTLLQQERAATRELQEFLVTRKKGTATSPSQVSVSDPPQAAAGRLGVGRMSAAIHDHLEKALQIATSSQELIRSSEARSKSVCGRAFDVQDDASSSLASAERSKSVVVGGDARRRRASLCLGSDTELAKGLAKLCSRSGSVRNAYACGANNDDEDEGSSVLPNSQKASCDGSSLNEEQEQAFTNIKTISTAQWKLAQSTSLGYLSHEHDIDENSHDGALPPLSLSLAHRYHSNTLDEEAWVGSRDGGYETATNSLASSVQHATTVAQRRNLGKRGRLVLPDNNHAHLMRELLSADEKARRGGKSKGEASTCDDTATDISIAASNDTGDPPRHNRRTGSGRRMGPMAQVKKLLGPRGQGQYRNAGFGRSCSARRGGALRSSSVKEGDEDDAFQGLDQLFLDFPDSREPQGNNIKRHIFGGADQMKRTPLAPSVSYAAGTETRCESIGG